MGENFDGRDLTGSVFRNTILTHAMFDGINLGEVTFHNVNLGKARFDDVNLGEAVIRNANLGKLSIEDSNIGWMTIFGYSVDEFIEAELDRRDPERARLRMTDLYDPECVRQVFYHLDEVRSGYKAFLRSLDRIVLEAQPEPGEWSALECLRHMLFAEDLYLNRWLLRNERPWLPEGLLPAFLSGQAGYMEVGSRPTADLEMVLAAWEELHQGTWQFVMRVTPDELHRSTRDIDFGQSDVAHVLQGLSQHDLLHIRQAEAAVARVRSR